MFPVVECGVELDSSTAFGFSQEAGCTFSAGRMQELFQPKVGILNVYFMPRSYSPNSSPLLKNPKQHKTPLLRITCSRSDFVQFDSKGANPCHRPSTTCSELFSPLRSISCGEGNAGTCWHDLKLSNGTRDHNFW